MTPYTHGLTLGFLLGCALIVFITVVALIYARWKHFR